MPLKLSQVLLVAEEVARRHDALEVYGVTSRGGTSYVELLIGATRRGEDSRFLIGVDHEHDPELLRIRFEKALTEEIPPS